MNELSIGMLTPFFFANWISVRYVQVQFPFLVKSGNVVYKTLGVKLLLMICCAYVLAVKYKMFNMNE